VNLTPPKHPSQVFRCACVKPVRRILVGIGDIIQGNERTDEAAKRAAIDKINPMNPPMVLKSARGNEIYQAIQKERDKKWLNGKTTARQLRNITKQNLTKLKRPMQSSRIYEKLRKGNGETLLAYARSTRG
jgi:hypothetical protein